MNSFNITAIPGTLTQKQLGLLSKAGVLDIDWGCETGSKTAASLVKRPISHDQIVDSVKHTCKEGMLAKTFWMVGLPGETKEDLSETAKLISRTIDVGGIPRWVTPVVALPLTDMFDNPGKYHMNLRMHRFEDYMAFSKTPLRKNAWYPELITHETEHLKVEDILRSSSLIREFIAANKDRVVNVIRDGGEKFVAMHPLWDLDRLIADTELSFRNVKLGYF